MLSSSLYQDLWRSDTEGEVQNLQGPIFVMGASGFIGAKLLFSLLRRRPDVYGVSRFPQETWRLRDVPSENLISADITNFEQLKEAFQKYKPKTIFNLTAYGAYERQRDYARIHAVNYVGVLNLIRLSMDVGCHAFVHAGSSSEYGRNCSGPHESSELVPNSDYAASKAAAAQLIKYYGTTHSVPVNNLRLYSIFGPFEERDRLMSRLIESLLKGKFPPLADPYISRDFVYVDDCTAAFVRAALTSCQSNKGDSINIATGTKTTLQELAFQCKAVFSITATPEFGSMQNRGWDLKEWFGNPGRASEVMNWRASISLEEGLRALFSWEKAATELTKFVPANLGRKKISAVIACYKDAQAIPIMHLRLTQVFRKIGVEAEIIFVNDCSPDEDEGAIKKIARLDPAVVGISHSRNFGSQAAFLSGMEIATGDAVVLLDGDLQDPPELIESFYLEWTKGYEVVYGVRVKREESWFMQICYKLFYTIFSGLADVKIPKDAGDFSLIDQRVVLNIVNCGERDIFVRGIRAWVGFKQTGVPYIRPKRMFGTSTNSLLKNIWWAKKGIFSFSTKPLEYMQRFGILMLLSTLLLGAFYLAYYLFGANQAPRGFTSVIILVLGGISLQLLSMSIIGDYIGKILEEVKGRPRYIRRRIMTSGSVFETEAEIRDFIAKREIISRG